MKDCTLALNHCSRTRATAAIGVALTTAALALGGWAPVARADGDPASDVLVTQPLFLPQDAGIPARQQAQLQALMAEAQRRGYQLRVALIASPTDLGSVTELWRQPQPYAQFLGEELSLVYRGQLLVVMPDGFGLYANGAPKAERSAISTLRAPGARGSFATAALTAIEGLAASSGHPLSVPSAAVSSSSGSFELLPWIVFAVGCALIAWAWTASLRTQPLRFGRRLTSPSRNA